jgi:hypothetical protein
VESAPLAKLETGTRVVVEVVGYPDGQFRIVTSVVEGHAGQRTIRQHDVLMFRDSDEAKDALDLLVDRLGEASI